MAAPPRFALRVACRPPRKALPAAPLFRLGSAATLAVRSRMTARERRGHVASERTARPPIGWPASRSGLRTPRAGAGGGRNPRRGRPHAL